jgi:polar amino acid transport system substrate-binding protein
VKQDFGFVTNDKTAPVDVSELKNQKVGLTSGYPYALSVTAASTKIQFAKDDVANMKKLSLGRIDVFVVEEQSGLKALKDSGATNITYAKGKPLSEQDVYFAFQNNDKGKAYAKAFTEALNSMKADGTFAKIMASAGGA